MRFLGSILALFFVCSCSKTKSKTDKIEIIPNKYILISSSKIRINQDTLFYFDKKFSGYVFDLYKNTKDTVFISSYLNGLNHGVSKRFYSNKKILEIRFYSNGKKNGKQISYWQNGNKRFLFIAVNDIYEGELKEWSIKNQLIHLAHYKNGQEDGVQKLWYDNGKIRANYVIKNGKRYGLLGTKNCRNVLDSVSSSL